MKLRIKGNSLRFRVTRTELDALGSAGRIVEVVPFPGGMSLRYELSVDPVAQATGASFGDNVVRVSIPAADYQVWRREDQVSLKATQPTDAATDLSILIEKDFACLVERQGEDDSDAFVHPSGPKVC